MHWWRWRCVCAYRGSLIHNQLQWHDARLGGCPDGAGAGRAGAELPRELALRPGSRALPLSSPLPPSLSLALALSPSRPPARI